MIAIGFGLLTVGIIALMLVFLAFRARLHCGALPMLAATAPSGVFLAFRARLHCGSLDMPIASAPLIQSSWPSGPGSIAARTP